MTGENRRLAAYFDRCASEGVMHGFAPEERPKIEQLMALWNLEPGEHVVEPGCGSGRLTERIAAAIGPSGRVLAFDISPGMIGKARERGLPGHVTFAVADATSIPADDVSFDVAVCFHAFPHLADPARALTELARVLRHGGRLFVNHLKSSREVNDFHRNASPEVADHVLPPEAEMRDLLTSAGFLVESVEDSGDGYSLRARRE